MLTNVVTLNDSVVHMIFFPNFLSYYSDISVNGAIKDANITNFHNKLYFVKFASNITTDSYFQIYFCLESVKVKLFTITDMVILKQYLSP